MLVARLTRSMAWKPTTPAIAPSRTIAVWKPFSSASWRRVVRMKASVAAQRVLPRPRHPRPPGGRGWPPRGSASSFASASSSRRRWVDGSRSQRSTRASSLRRAVGPRARRSAQPTARSVRDSDVACCSPAEVAESCSSIRSARRPCSALRSRATCRRVSAGRTIALCPASIVRGAADSVSDDRPALPRAAERRGRRRDASRRQVVSQPTRSASVRARSSPDVRSSRRLDLRADRRRAASAAWAAAGWPAAPAARRRPATATARRARTAARGRCRCRSRSARRGSPRAMPVGWTNCPAPVPRAPNASRRCAVGPELLHAVVAAVGDPEVAGAVERQLGRAR